MQSKRRILIASRSKPALEQVAAKLEPHGARYAVVRRHIENGHSDPLYGVSELPDVVVLVLNDQGHHDLAALLDEQSPGRPPMIVLAERGDAQTMRLAMQAGARDFLPGVVSEEDLIASIGMVSARAGQREDQAGRLTAFVNAKGGSGATFIACNAAHMLSAASERSTALLSLDMQFESLAQYFDMDLRHGLLQVLDAVDTLDAVALDAFMTRHASGLRMLAAQPERTFQRLDDRAPALDKLLNKMMDRYDHVVVDIPRRVDAFTRPVLQKASRVVLVVQQTLSHLRDAARMLQICDSYGVSPNQVLVVVNRFDKTAPVGLEDIERALQGTEIVAVPSDFKMVAESINLGIPMYEHARGSSVTKALLALHRELGGRAESATGIFRALTSVLRKESWSRA